MIMRRGRRTAVSVTAEASKVLLKAWRHEDQRHLIEVLPFHRQYLETSAL